MQTPYINIILINHSAHRIITKMLESKIKSMRKSLLKEHKNDLYDYNDNQIDDVLKYRFEEYANYCSLLDDFNKKQPL